jgi:hypothetical protein
MKVIKANGDEGLLRGAAALVKKGTGGDATFTWHPVNLTWKAWKVKISSHRHGAWRDPDRADSDYPTHSGTLLLTERGVFGCGLLGTFLAGSKRADGSIDRSGASLEQHLDTDAEIILEYADPDYGKHGCHRDATTGAIVCKCPDEW